MGKKRKQSRRKLSANELREQSARELPNREEMAVINTNAALIPTIPLNPDTPTLPAGPSTEPPGPPPSI